MSPTLLLGGELELRCLGFGAMRIVRDPDEGKRVLRRALELGVNLIDTADVYGAGRSEELIAEALHPYPERLVIATKGGLGYGLQKRIRNARPERLRQACEEPAPVRARADRPLPVAPPRSGRADRGVRRRAGAAPAGGEDPVDRALERLRRATAAGAVGGSDVSVQNQYNRGLLTSDGVLEACEAEGIAFLPWEPLGEALGRPEDELRWLLDRSPVMLPIPGTSKVAHREEDMRAVA